MTDDHSIAVKCGRCDLDLSSAPVLGRITADGSALVLIPADRRPHIRRGVHYPGQGDVYRNDAGPRLAPASRRGRGVEFKCRRCKARPTPPTWLVRHAATIAVENGWPFVLLDHLGCFTGPRGERLPHYRPTTTVGGEP